MSRRRLLLTALAVLFSFLTSSGVWYYRQPEEGGAAREQIGTPPRKGEEWPVFIARVVRVVDGDTVLVETAGRKERVRLLHVDTPESVHPDAARNTAEGKVASDYTKRQLEGRQVVLESDPEQPFDRHGRRLAYVFLEGENFNLKLVREGYSPYYTGDGKSRKYDAEFRKAERLRLSN